MKYLSKITKQTLKPEHTELLAEACKVTYTGATSEHILTDAAQGIFQLWDISEGEGIVVTKVLIHPAGKELFIWAMAGKRLWGRWKAIVDDLNEERIRLGARFLGANSMVPKHKQMLELIANPVATQFVIDYEGGN